MNKFNAEDMKDHRTVALAAERNGKLIFSINKKHNMITFPIGKVHDDETLEQGLTREIREELGVDIGKLRSPIGLMYPLPLCKYTKVYDFTGKPVKVETTVYGIDDTMLTNPIWDSAYNAEPDKCLAVFASTIDSAKRLAAEYGLKIADCILEYEQWIQDGNP